MRSPQKHIVCQPPVVSSNIGAVSANPSSLPTPTAAVYGMGQIENRVIAATAQVGVNWKQPRHNLFEFA
eukprot:CAMPEP_0175889750 /NCGR_PEP_ID=MMETSP0107_2-20121207/47448_1 /TAXON_ID=195067 ORGANISM="Goniomonas pacifica, Strain CCMP1869" /NCGR_SAMPLE_ID=MMETSP0107_2 /ASSEMBLY_ACC=CAM_ASM_000203 /LENGTH=68 /DNA_ID=CAMNT_0017210443 /DNA_START=449 /DNA_END=652 /DNA_ORIENTATION=+